MIPGTTAFVGLIALSPWMPRQADNARFSFQKIDHVGTNVSLKIEVVTKNSEDPGDGGAPVTGNVTLDNADLNGHVEVTEWLGLKELVRFKYTVSGDAGAWIHFQQLAPVWFDTPA